jgi:hypothetical protein
VEPVIAPEVASIVVFPPVPAALARPAALIVAAPGFVDVHVTELVKFCVLLSLYVPVAVYCSVAPSAIDAFAGVTASDTNTGAVIVRPVEPVIAPEVACIVVLPVPTPVAKPVPLTVAAPVFVEVHVTALVRFNVLLSLYVPVAVNCCVAPFAIDGFTGLTAIDTRAAVTVKPVEPLTDPEVACIVVLPVFTPVASPVAPIVAATVLVELHVTELVRFCVLLSLYVPVAVNCCVALFTIDPFAGVTVRETNTGAVTVNPVEPLIDPDVACIVVLPVPTLVASPAALTVATAGLVEDHVTELVRFCVLLSLYVPVAVYCSVAPSAIETFAGATDSDTSGAPV